MFVVETTVLFTVQGEELVSVIYVLAQYRYANTVHDEALTVTFIPDRCLIRSEVTTMSDWDQ